MPLRYASRILQHMKHRSYRPQTLDEISNEMSVEEVDHTHFDTAVNAMIEEGRLECGADDKLRLPEMRGEITGTYRANRRGFGFVVPDVALREGDLFIPQGSSADALNGDTVIATVSSRGDRGPRRKAGRITQVIERHRTSFVGTVSRKGHAWFIDPDRRAPSESVLLRDPHAKNVAVGDKVVFELTRFPDTGVLGEGVVTEVLGRAGDPGVETRAVIAAHCLRTTFPPEAMEEARAAAQRLEEVETDREDLRQTLTFTIDPPTAKDFDDAISITRNGAKGTWELGVHIADVTHFIAHGGVLDLEASERGNSVYLPRLVLPMLPEVLSNGVCSLQEGVDRLTRTAFITFDDRGVVQSQRVCRSIIRSAKRMTYLEAQGVLDGDAAAVESHQRTSTPVTPELVAAMRECQELATRLKARRRRDGAIVLNLPQAELIFDDDGHVTNVQPEDDAFTHTIIEMFMVEANEALARLFHDLSIPVLRRIHPDPPVGDIAELRSMAAAAGFKVPTEPSRHDLQRLLESTAGTPASRAIHLAVLRTLTKAEYSPAIIGHYALASQHYAHFTSPIRRYPDLLLHRQMQVYLELTNNGQDHPKGDRRKSLRRKIARDPRVLSEEALVEMGRHCSETEKEAESAERELREFLILSHLEETMLGEDLPGAITGFSGSGVWVMLDRYLVDGMVGWDGMPSHGNRPDSWVQVEGTGRIVAKRSGRVLSIGDDVTVRLTRIDPGSSTIDLQMIDAPMRQESQVNRPKPAHDHNEGKRGKGGKHRRGKRRR
jgi:ribonuclease R